MDNEKMPLAEEISFQSGEITLAGSLFKPNTGEPFPAIIFVHGSGPETREGSRSYAEYFANAGIASLVYDKRGTGHSMGECCLNSVGVLADDVVAAFNYLKGRSDINGDQIGLWGGSQGGWIVPLAVTRAPDVAFLVIVSAPLYPPAQQFIYGKENEYLAAGYPEPLIEGNRRIWQLATDYDGRKLTGDLVCAPFPSLGAHQETVHLGIQYDPLPAWKEVTRPVLAIWGEQDTVVPVQDNIARLSNIFRESGNADLTIKVFPSANHWLYGSYAVLDTEVNWIRPRVGLAPLPERKWGEITNPAYIESGDFGPGGRFAPLSWYGVPEFQLVLVTWFLCVFSITLLGASFVWVRRGFARKVGRATDLSWGKGVAIGTSVLGLVLLVGSIALRPLDSTVYRVSPWWFGLRWLVLPWSVLVLIKGVYVLIAWKRRAWPLVVKGLYTITLFADLGFTWWLIYWRIPF